MSMDREPGRSDHSPIRVASEAELARLPLMLPGTVVERLAPDGHAWRFIAAGCLPQVVLHVLGWYQQNVWLRQEERDYIESKRPDLFIDVPAAIAAVLADPLSVHDNPRAPGTVYVVTEGGRLRSAGLLQSTRVLLVDLVVETRSVLGGSFLRVTHFSPTRRNFGGRQVWP
jgi:hypothetical protein